LNFLQKILKKKRQNKGKLKINIVKTKYRQINLIQKIQIRGYFFDTFNIGIRKDILWSISIDKKAFIKIENNRFDRKKNSVNKESEIIKILNNNQAQSAPRLIEASSIQKDLILRVISNDDFDIANDIKSSPKDRLDYLMTDYIPSQDNCLFSDVVLSIIEQKSLGIYHGDIKPSNIRFNNGLAILIDYDQSTILDESIKKYNIGKYFEWISSVHFEQYKDRNWLRHFSGITQIELDNLFKNNAFNLAETSLYMRQLTTNTTQGVYHTIQEKEVFAEGVRSLDSRLEILDKITFLKNEKVLDIGCNIGLLSIYLSRRMCDVTGYELDPSIVSAAKIVNNILKTNIVYESHDLDSHIFTEQFDTVMLFSVFHHTRNMISNGKKIAKNCNRVIIECRLVENGRKPDLKTREWHATSVWEYKNKEDLFKGLEEYFPSFFVYKDYGAVDKGRRIIELRKNNEYWYNARQTL